MHSVLSDGRFLDLFVPTNFEGELTEFDGSLKILFRKSRTDCLEKFQIVLD